MDGLEKNGAVLLPVEAASLWEGCVLALCVNGVMLPEYPFISNDHIWLDGLYLTMDHAGAKAVLAFSEENLPLAGVFRQFSSRRTSLVLSEKYARYHFKLAAQERQEMAEALFCLFEEPVGEQILPVVTAGFWSDGGQLYSADSMEDWLENGGSILAAQMMPFDEAMACHEQLHSMDSARAKIAERIYREKIQSPSREILLTGSEVELLRSSGDVHNMAACEEAFAALGVYFEK